MVLAIVAYVLLIFQNEVFFFFANSLKSLDVERKPRKL